jgi:hypothetical protein
MSAARARQKPQLVFRAVVERRVYWRRARFALLALAAVALGMVALRLARDAAAADLALLDLGFLAALIAAVLLGVRVVVNLLRWRRRHDETLAFFDQGFVWTRDGTQHKYGWSKLAVLREGAGGLYLRRRPLVQWGAHTLTMTDGQVFRVTPVYGDLRRFVRAVRPLAAEVTGARMGRTLRQERPVRLHPQLTVWPGGVEAGKREIPWAELAVKVKQGRLVIYAKNEKGRFTPVRRYRVSRVDNVGGFLDLAGATIRNHQPERFTRKPASV